MKFLASFQSISLIKKTAFSTLAVLSAFAVVYVPFLFYLGYSYELHVVSNVVFTLLSMLIILGLLRGGSGGFEGVNKVKMVFGVLAGVVLLEELLLNSVFAMYGLALSILGLVSLPALAVVLSKSNSRLRVALETVALIFASRVVLFPFPLGFLDLPAFLPTIYTLIFVGLVLYLTYRGVSTREMRISAGNRGLGFQLGVGLGVGVFLGFAEYLVLKPQPILVGIGMNQMLAYIVIVPVLMVSVVEEIMFRGLFLSSLERVIPRWQAIGVSSVIFGLMHVGWMNPLEVVLAYGAGVAFGYMATETDSLISPIVAHGFGNLVLYLIVMHPI